MDTHLAGDVLDGQSDERMQPAICEAQSCSPDRFPDHFLRSVDLVLHGWIEIIQQNRDLLPRNTRRSLRVSDTLQHRVHKCLDGSTSPVRHRRQHLKVENKLENERHLLSERVVLLGKSARFTLK